MTKKELMNAIYFLEKSYVGQSEQDRLFETIEALKRELEKRNTK